jgi:hypothetical protein
VAGPFGSSADKQDKATETPSKQKAGIRGPPPEKSDAGPKGYALPLAGRPRRSERGTVVWKKIEFLPGPGIRMLLRNRCTDVCLAGAKGGGLLNYRRRSSVPAMKKPSTIYGNCNPQVAELFASAGLPKKVMCVALDYAKAKHTAPTFQRWV